ncbi:hypothetical protein N0V82_005319 [Gnomoniopsis sp. IMI 355080]|nr:hypothetical protein N0V82_005319 [Gnomoniopsis sp. IMI 355080]
MEYTAAGTPGSRGHALSQSSASSPGLDGQLPHASPATDASPPPAKRRRTRTDKPNGNGCLNCRARKTLAAPDEQPHKVQQSIEPDQLVSPSLSSSPLKERHRGFPSTQNLLVEDILARKVIITNHFRMWFKTWARVPLINFLNERSTYLEIEENRLNHNIGKIVCAITTRFLNPNLKQLPSFAEMCAEDVERYILQHMGSFLKEEGRENLIILVITICHFWMELEMGKVWMFMGLAGRMITALQLNWDGAGGTRFEQESVRRAVWEVWKLDRRLAGGFDEHLILRDEFMHLSRPVRDEDIPEENMGVIASVSGSRPVPPPLYPDGRPPLCVFHIDLCRMKHHILFVTKNLAISPTPHPRPRVELSQVLESVNQLQCQLFQFHQSLPDYLKVSDSSIAKWAWSPDCASFVMIYTMFCELHIDLYRFSIPGLREEADPEIARQLPQDFVEKSRNQAVGYAVSLSRFWQSMQVHVSKRPADDGTEKLLSYDTTLILSIVQSTKVLLAARKHLLFSHLGEGSSAPLVRESPVTDDCLATLIQSNMGLFDAYSHFIPRTIDIYTRDLRAAVQNFQRGIPYDNPRQTIGMPARKPPQNVRLPGPHYMLEQAIAPPEEEDRAMHRNKSGADILFRQKKQASNDSLNPSNGSSVQDEAANSEKPDIPQWLATARARDAPATVSSTPVMPQQSPQTPFPPYQNQYGPQHSGSPAVPQAAPPASSLPYQAQYGQLNPMPMITDSAPQLPLSTPYAPQQTPSHPHAVPPGTRQQLLSNSVRSSSWQPEGRSSSSHASPPAPGNFTQSPHSAQPFQYTNQPPAQPVEEESQPSASAGFPQQPHPVHTTYQNQLPQRPPLEQHSADGQGLVGSHIPPNYWAHQPPTPFELPQMTSNHSTGRPPPLPLAYSQGQGAGASATPPQLPFPVSGQARSLLANVTPGYYVRAAGTLQKYPADLVHP